MAILEGSDPALRGEYVALGAHNDAIGIVAPVDHDSLRAYNTVVRPRGANDPAGDADAGAVGTDQEHARQPAPAAAGAAGFDRERRRRRRLRLDGPARDRRGDEQGAARPKRSLLFVWHTGEESGLQGSRWFTDHPTVPRDSIVAQINIDMIARGGPDDENGRARVRPGDRLAAALHRAGRSAEKVNTEGKHGFVFDYTYDADGHPDNFYCRSDHYMYARYGIPIVFFSTGGHRDYHQVTDEAQYLDYDKFVKVTSVRGRPGHPGRESRPPAAWWTSRSRTRRHHVSSSSPSPSQSR